MRHRYQCAVCGGTEHRTELSGILDWEYGTPGTFSHARCLRCRTVQLHPMPDIEDLVRAYQVDYHGYVDAADKGALYDLLYRLNDRALKRALAGLITPGCRVLDVGCGSGELLARVSRMGAAEIDGIDFSERAVSMARARGARAFQGVFLDYPAEEGSYDVIFMNNYLEHTLDPLAEARRARRLLRPGGALVGELPNYRSLDRLLFGRFWGGNHAPRHTFQFEEDTLSALLRAAGFDAVRTLQQVNSTHFALSFQNLLESRRAAPRLQHGRAPYYNALLWALAPLNLLCAIFHRSGVMKFRATVSEDAALPVDTRPPAGARRPDPARDHARA